ncbi:hypothetical protein RJ639_025383 [Escallonia herrerae]|uniref:Cytochrome P450 n=1 Tax=Escallonia herrerae TaxID=1293975 RepID=A0AA88UYZ6_9ASTE|nr:hypothetical protein RJ639_025383 [Escallonia herrerae]
MKRILRYVKGTTQLGLQIRFASSFDLYAFCDADWAGSLQERYLERGARIKTFSYTNQRDSKVSGGFDVADLFPSKKFLHVLTGLRPKLLKIHYKLDKILDNIISERREILASIQKGGTETSSTTIKWAMVEMLRNSKVMEKAQAEVRQAIKQKKTIGKADIQELSYLKLMIKETLRLHAPVPLLVLRKCREGRKIGGYNILVKTKVIVNAWAMGRDPDYWHDAETFIPERFEKSPLDFTGTNLEYIPFGAGRRMCPGVSLG